EIVRMRELDGLRDYVRRGRPGFVWPVNIRKIYDASRIFVSSGMDPFQVLHEWDILAIPEPGQSKVYVCYAVVAIFGIEYVINLGGPELDLIRKLNTA
ncbi:MAG: hypothetical protein JXK93_08740, partial [Sphaerochaetaceae bacterium]|nr:hypothetical protein [Sphaerochaetaceae bacterium]